MTTDTTDYSPSHTASNASPGIEAGTVSWNLGDSSRRTIPALIRADQAYYWSARWRKAEADATADYEAGRFETFESPRAAVERLLRAED